MERRTTYRRKVGGAVHEASKAVIDSVEMRPNMLVNPSSKFVVATYWWGRGNLNKNTQKPCPEDILDPIKEAFEEDIGEEAEKVNPEFKTIMEDVRKWNALRKERPLNLEELQARALAERKRAGILRAYMTHPEIVAKINVRYNEEVEKLRKEGKFTEPIKFEDMITKWEETCKKANCNYLSVEYKGFEGKAGYQLAINAKPLFIRKALDACQGRGVLYIDGDMFVNKYPAIFDMDNVDYMARGWGVDPRSSRKYKTHPCFDPYIFETSGGTMFFANTTESKRILDEWAYAAAEPINAGKADDRVVSMTFTNQRLVLTSNLIQLPIEYLWLTDMYGFIDPADGGQSGAIIEHPACLTGEERATDQGAASNREPTGYGEMMKAQECARRGGVFYEYVFFPKKEMVSEYGPYLSYMKSAKNEAGEPMFKIVDFEDRYGSYNTVALKNADAAKNTPVAEGVGHLPLNPPIKDVLAYLTRGYDVQIGETPAPPPTAEFSARNLGSPEEQDYVFKINVDVQSPMYISAKNPVVIHLLSMCETLSDINKHLQESYVFVSRIRWNLYADITTFTPKARRAARKGFAQLLGETRRTMRASHPL